MANGRLHPFIAIEGVDLAGKTTTAALLARRLGAACHRTPRAELENARLVFDRPGAQEARFLFYLASVVLEGQRIERRLEAGPVVCDRYLHSTLAYHEALGVDLAAVKLNRLPVPRPDLTVLLTASRAVRNVRLAGRSQSTRSDRLIEENIDLQAAVERAFARMGLPVVDTSLRTPEEVVDEILRMIGGARTALL